jgi:hypothetical protein
MLLKGVLASCEFRYRLCIGITSLPGKMESYVTNGHMHVFVVVIDVAFGWITGVQSK